MPNHRFALFLLILLGSLASLPAQSKASDPKKILFVGNSYTGGIRKSVIELIKASPHAKTELTFINPGGKTLAFHLENKATTDKIKNGDYDFVVLQDQSQTPAVFPEQFKKAAVALDKIIDQSGAQTVFYETWGRRDGDKQNPKLFPDFESMQAALTKSYRSAARTCQAKLAPVGSTWNDVLKKDPKLGLELYQKDGSHPSQKGSYLAACVFYATFFKEDPRKLIFTGGLPDPEAKLIRELAYAQSHARR